ncbi:hypothetical protein APR12_002357 [Nocardia amikacinitolerans]|nr:hypothetical protein [Nocardia amikacinitolerans]
MERSRCVPSWRQGVSPKARERRVRQEGEACESYTPRKRQQQRRPPEND